jgi:hypothetical protein
MIFLSRERERRFAHSFSLSRLRERWPAQRVGEGERSEGGGAAGAGKRHKPAPQH